MEVFSKHCLFLLITGRNRKKSESKITPPTVNLPPTSTVSSVANRPPPGPPTFTSTPSTTPLSAPLAPPQPQATSKLESSENRKRGPGRPPGSTKQNIEQQRMQQQLQQQQVSFISVSYFWENLGNRSEQAKGEKISKGYPKKRMNEFDVVVKTNSFVRFLGEFEETKSPFEIIWPLLPAMI